MKGQKPHDPLNRCRKSLGLNSTPFHDKSSEKKLVIEEMFLNIINLQPTLY
jgi:hypothetical protein